MSVDLGVPDLSPLPGLLRDPSLWAQLERELDRGRYLRSEGVSSLLGPPQVLSGELLGRCRQVVASFDAFYRHLVEAHLHAPARSQGILRDPFFDLALDAEPRLPTLLPLSRLDCVLTQEGDLRVIEINPVGICTIHLRAAACLARALARRRLDEDASRVDTLHGMAVDSFRRFHQEAVPDAPAGHRLRVGFLCEANRFRGTRRTWRHAFSARGFDFLDGQAHQVEASPEGLLLRGQKVDLLWGDYLFYLAYQHARYPETRFESPMGDFAAARRQAERLLTDGAVLETFRQRQVAVLSPARAYLALSKGLLARAHRPDPDLPEELRASLEPLVARTYDVEDRLRGTLSVAQAIRDREALVLKPCRFGGGHGVELGRETPADRWGDRLRAIWEDHEWVLQHYHPPRRSPDGRVLSLGLHNYGGRLGGVTVRAGESLVVSARRSRLIPVVHE